MTDADKARWQRRLDSAIWLLVLVLAFGRFAHLGYGDLADWDESFHAWRAKVICLCGVWRDQSGLAFGGFLTATYPPLQIWATAVLFQLFGFSEFAARFWSALAGAGSVIVLFLMGRRLGRSQWTGLFAALFLASVEYYARYTRRGQLDAAYTFFTVVSLYGYVAYLDRLRIVGWRRVSAERGAGGWLVLSGAALGVGWMSKMVLSAAAPAVAGGLGLYGWLRDRRRMGLLAATLFVAATFCILSRMKGLGERLEAAVFDPGLAAASGDAVLKLALVLAGVAAVVAAPVFLVRPVQRFRVAALAILTGVTVLFCAREIPGTFARPRGIEARGWQQVRPWIDSMDYRTLVFVGGDFGPAATYYLNGLNLNWHPDIVFASLPQYDESRLTQLAASRDSRIIVSKSWIEQRWTPEERARLLDRLELLAGGSDFSIYRPRAE